MQVRDRVKLYKDEICREALALFNTGAKSTFVDEKLAEELGFERVEPYKVPLAIREKYGVIVGDLTVVFEVDGCKLPKYTARVVRNLREEVIIGASMMEEFDIYLDLKTGKAGLKKKPPELSLI